MPSPPIWAAHLLAPLEEMLVALLKSLRREDWSAPTIVRGWTVHHVAAHLLDTSLRKLSIVRDGFARDTPDGDIASFVHRLNAEGVAVYGRLSPEVLTSRIEATAREYAQFHESLDPMAPALFAVSWAGETQSLNWFDTARELTERWHHQQQIRLALDRPGILTPRFYRPVLETFARGLPHSFRTVAAAEGTCVQLEVTGESGGRWTVERAAGEWQLIEGDPKSSVTRVRIPEEIAWRVFTRGIRREEAMLRIGVEGDAGLAEPILSHTAVVA